MKTAIVQVEDLFLEGFYGRNCPRNLDNTEFVEMKLTPVEISYYYYPPELGRGTMSNPDIPDSPGSVEIIYVAHLGFSVMDIMNGEQFDDIERQLLDMEEDSDGY